MSVQNPKISTARGLNLFDPLSAVPLGDLVRAQNKAIGFWGPRHGHSFIDRVSRGRQNPTLNGTDSYLTIYYNSEQLDLGNMWTLDTLWKITTLKACSLIRTSAGPLDISIAYGTGYHFVVSLYGSVSTSVTFTSSDGLISAGDTFHLRILRERENYEVYLDSVRIGMGDDFGAEETMQVSSADWILGKNPSGGEFFSGVFGGLYLRNYVDRDFSYAYMELPGPRNLDVRGAWTGELVYSQAAVFDASRWVNHAICTNCTVGNKVPLVVEPIQVIAHHGMRDGRRHNLIVVGGNLHREIL